MKEEVSNCKSLIKIGNEYTFVQNLVSSILYGISAMLFIAGMIIAIIYSVINKN